MIQIAYTFIYVLPFYFSPTTRPSPTLSRDAPSVIRRRIQSVTISCIICSITTFVVLTLADENKILLANSLAALHQMGYVPVGIAEAARSLALTAILFVGPLFESGIVEGNWRSWIRLRGLDAVVSSWIGWRNMVAVGVFYQIPCVPITNISPRVL